MRFFWVKTPAFISWFFHNYIWRIYTSEQKIYLTFDDGPIPEITEWVLDLLKKENINATFFCIGDNIEKYPEIFKRILKEKHAIGNHTYNHLNGWKANTTSYIENFNLCHKTIEKHSSGFHFTKLFRPPYGKIKNKQAIRIIRKEYKIVMWDILSYDFDINTSPEKCLENVIKNVSKGSIIVFHDSLKAHKNLQFALPKTIEILKQKGYVFETIS
ncbi:polysaccharide deacetylase family protein [Flavobacterium sp. J27]|uniref:polysaccharide deacetylase family protein n=1 Tax=Flavobacterium sp. J27 TaxID=2060419 RepID=UPI00102FB2C9|nr:polysaccharide deacetylase family protein [Flavobacterium sp. J27]